ncbi:peptidoglycan DD-metalloendopeptidase family protein [Aliiroseovarius sp. KMU-50]|uniref:Peptidoglycan DD-metalloendopeptidase family protein n=1 Tax=Aliiroseovarius salicola TaxID=3009082 RepID=A0ABT4W1I2_9RHOB|nr:LysM peptidoglycan-binding domain-containing protein [Aliiroseovarius sp. KMU-50]MDA5094366.1 peptidoglycan DD-metalloendopeptidase family protein [Aliiroseovarius sp. KMU-50]
MTRAMTRRHKTLMRGIPLLVTAAALSACTDGFDFDMRPQHGGLSTTQAVQNVQTANRPSPDARGVISYPTYQVALARRGDSVADVANRLGIPAAELARYNGIAADTPLRRDELLALPRRVQEPSSGPITPGGEIDIQTLAGDAIDRAPATRPTDSTRKSVTSGEEPLRHRVERGETAYSIARLYGVSVRSLADWNGLGAELAVREGQHLLIPVKVAKAATTSVSRPGEGSTTPTPPSAAQPLPDEKPSAVKPATAPASPELNGERTTASSARMSLPVSGKITSLFDADKAGYILIAAKPGAAVKAAAAGTVRLVSKDVEGEEIVVIDHGNNTQTAYSFIEGISVSKGQKVKRGQPIAKATKNQYNAIQFLVFNGTDPVDPMPYLN